MVGKQPTPAEDAIDTIGGQQHVAVEYRVIVFG